MECAMIVILGLIVLVGAVVVAVAGVLGNGGSGHALTHGFAVSGHQFVRWPAGPPKIKDTLKRLLLSAVRGRWPSRCPAVAPVTDPLSHATLEHAA
jgi:hypothetical protein